MTRSKEINRINWVPVLLLLSLYIPVYFFVGPVRLTVYRVILLIAFVPLLLRLISGSVKVYLFDVVIIASFFWSVLSISIIHGFLESVEANAIYFIEGVGAYLCTRTLISNRQEFLVFVKVLFFMALMMVPFALYESMTGQPIIMDVLRKAFSVPPSIVQDKRLGLERSQVVFEHSILFGVFCSSIFGMTYYVLNRQSNIFARGVRLFIVSLASFLSISGGAVLAIFIQCIWIGWDRVTMLARIPNRWWLLTFGFVAAYVGVDVLSNRSPFHVFVSYLTFSPGSAYNRILIWQYGTETVSAFPFFGIGMGRWLGPEWMGDSIDNFWLLLTMRYGMPGGIGFIIGIIILMTKLGGGAISDLELSDYRKGYMVSLGGLIVAGCTVHYWNATYILFMMILGSGVWILNEKTSSVPEKLPELEERRSRAFLRRKAALATMSEQGLAAEDSLAAKVKRRRSSSREKSIQRSRENRTGALSRTQNQ